MFVLKALAEKGKNIVDKTKKNITQLSSKIYDYAANTRLAKAVNKYYNRIKNVPYATTKFVTNLADRLLFRSRAQTGEEKRLAIDQIKSDIPKDLTEHKEKPLDVNLDKDVFFYKVKDKLLMVDINIPIEKYQDRNIRDGEFVGWRPPFDVPFFIQASYLTIILKLFLIFAAKLIYF
jgi:hypothetical protein